MSIKIPLDIIANSAKALKDIKKFSKQSATSLSKVESSFNQLKLLAVGVGGILAGRAIANGIRSITDAASRQEDAINSLNTAMALAGEYSQEASKDIQKFASELQKTTTIGDEATLEMFALSRTFARSNEEAKRLTEAAIELNAAGLLSLEGGVRNLGKSFSGLAGELGEAIPEIRNLSAEALKSGAAVDLVLSKFGGSAASKINTFSGAMKQLENVQGDFTEQLGNLIIKNPIVIKGIQAITAVFLKLSAMVERNRHTIILFINNAVIALLRKFDFLISSIGEIVKFMSRLNVVFKAAGKSIGAALAILSSFRGEMSFKESVAAIKEIGTALKEDLITDLKESAKTHRDTDKVVKVATDTLGTYADELEKIKDNTDQVTDSIRNQNKAAGQGTDIFKNLSAKKIGLDISTNISKGAEGAGALVSGMVAGIGDAIAPGFGQAFAGVFDLLNQEQDAMRESITSFTNELIEIPFRIAENIPVIISTLIENIPRFIDTLIENIPSLIQTLTEQFVLMVPTIAIELVNALISEAPRFITEMIKQIPKAIGGGITKGVGGFFGGIGDIFGFAEGGRVPDTLRNANDGMVARVSAGEQIFRKDLSNRLENYLDRQDGGGAGSESQIVMQPVNISIGEQDFANVMLRIDRKNLRTRVT